MIAGQSHKTYDNDSMALIFSLSEGEARGAPTKIHKTIKDILCMKLEHTFTLVSERGTARIV